jgi:hypothetical protein
VKKEAVEDLPTIKVEGVVTFSVCLDDLEKFMPCVPV